MLFRELTNPQVILKPTCEVSSPIGYDPETKLSKLDAKKPSQAQLDKLKVKKAWEFATSPAKSIPMNLIMSYMTGNSLQMIPMMMTFMLLWSPLAAIFNDTNRGFEPFATERNRHELILPKLVFILCHVASILIGVWKLDKMGIIPHKEADWMDWKVPATIAEKLSVSF
ncbi:hypothetical protein PUMCH_001887 [Australozyma saopauloensis]|uniref:ER membrane protein complex subunit 4 n=1 Tax=Australozyma saopauloensis TaxID=291208 RepID=A0AAX4H7R9_9ASCO|nr:hypothetical protein PUMCH_001887 [[Candida] saopauloensis]